MYQWKLVPTGKWGKGWGKGNKGGKGGGASWWENRQARREQDEEHARLYRKVRERIRMPTQPPIR